MKHGVYIIACILAGMLAALHLGALGPLDPPGGPVTPTEPSLADLEAKIDSIASDVASGDFESGPWQVFRAPATGSGSSSLTAQLVAEGPVYVKSVTSFSSRVTVFDGPGAINQDGQPLTDNWIARSLSRIGNSGSGNTVSLQSETVPVEQVVAQELRVAWFTDSGRSFVYVLYRELEDTP